jgi:hypothetical protein
MRGFPLTHYVPGSSVAVPHNLDAYPNPNPTFHFDEDPDPTFYFDANPNPTFHFEADPDLASYQSDQSCKSLTTSIQILHGSILILQASTVSGRGPPWLHFLSLHNSGSGSGFLL